MTYRLGHILSRLGQHNVLCSAKGVVGPANKDVLVGLAISGCEDLVLGKDREDIGRHGVRDQLTALLSRYTVVVARMLAKQIDGRL